MENFKMITCIIQRGKAEKAVKAALEAGAEGATIFYARGTGVRQKLGVIGKLIQPEKEVILVVIKESQEETVFKALAEAAELDKPGHGIAFVHGIEKVAGYFDSTK